MSQSRTKLIIYVPDRSLIVSVIICKAVTTAQFKDTLLEEINGSLENSRNRFENVMIIDEKRGGYLRWRFTIEAEDLELKLTITFYLT